MRVDKRVEALFAHAAALHQSGKLKNTVYCIGKFVFCLNQDHTILLKFVVRGEVFEHPVSFEASDYDSQEIEEQDGVVKFVQRDSSGFDRTKMCSTPNFTPQQIVDVFGGFGKPVGGKVTLPSAVCGLLEDNLSHVEFRGVDGCLSIVQRNIYTGTLIEVTRGKLGDIGLGLGDGSLEDFGPIALRTDDFFALYSFAEGVDFWFGGSDVVFFKSTDSSVAMSGIIGQCVYDELGGELVQTKEGG